MRKRLHMRGGEYCCKGWVGDCAETCLCLPFTVCQEARELEIRTGRRWHWLRGFRGIGETLSTACFGEETLERVCVEYSEEVRDILKAGMPDDDDDASVTSKEDTGSVKSGLMEVPGSVDLMTR